MTDNHIHTEALTSPTGATLHTRWIAPAAPRAIVQINHGLAEHSARYAPFMERLADAGFAAVAHDHRGHGHTTAPDAPQGRFADTDGQRKVIEDTAFIRDWCTDKWPSTPVISFGHSLGGLIALNTAVTYPDRLHGLAVWNSNAALGPRGVVGQALTRAEAAITEKSAPARLAPALTFAAWDKRFASDGPQFHWLSPDGAEVAKYVDDPLCGFDCSTALWVDVFRLARTGEDRKALQHLPPNLPIHLVAGSNDPATDNGTALARLEKALIRAGRRRVSLKIYAGARHETLNGPMATAATDEFIAWIESILTPASATA